MATITPTQKQFVGNNDIGDMGIDGWQVTWGPLSESDAPVAVSFPGYADKTVQVEGNFGTGGHVTIQGSNDLTNFRTLNQPNDTAIDISAAAINQILEHVIQYKPKVTAGTGLSVTVTMFFRKTQAQ